MNSYNFVSTELCKSLSWMFQFASNRAEGFINPSSNLQEIKFNDEIGNNTLKYRFKLNIIILILAKQGFQMSVVKSKPKLK